MNNEILIGFIGVVSTFLSGFTSWFFTRKKYNSEVDSTVISNLREALNVYKDISDDNTKRLNEALLQNQQKDERIANLESEVRELRNQMFELMNNICYDLSCAYRMKLPKEQMNNEPKRTAKGTKAGKHHNTETCDAPETKGGTESEGN